MARVVDVAYYALRSDMDFLEITIRDSGGEEEEMAINPAAIIKVAPSHFGAKIWLLPNGECYRAVESYRDVMRLLYELDRRDEGE